MIIPVLKLLKMNAGLIRKDVYKRQDQTCMHMGDAQPGRPVVCVPNEVLIVIEDVLDVDGVTG